MGSGHLLRSIGEARSNTKYTLDDCYFAIVVQQQSESVTEAARAAINKAKLSRAWILLLKSGASPSVGTAVAA